MKKKLLSAHLSDKASTKDRSVFRGMIGSEYLEFNEDVPTIELTGSDPNEAGKRLADYDSN